MIDAELESWKREWRDGTDPFPQLKRKIARQNLATAAGIFVMLLCMASSVVAALHFSTAFMSGLVAGIWTTALMVGGYAWWVRRGAWRAVAQTTLAYAELSHRRAVARARVMRFLLSYLLIALVLLAGLFAWDWRHFSMTAALVMAALLIELLVFLRLRQRREREIEATRQFLEQARELATAQDNEG